MLREKTACVVRWMIKPWLTKLPTNIYRLSLHCKLCNSERGSSIGVYSFSSTTQKAEIWSLTCSSTSHSKFCKVEMRLIFGRCVSLQAHHSSTISVRRYLNAIQTMCPHILRYLTTAVITNKRRRTVLKDLVKVIQQVKKSVFQSDQIIFTASKRAVRIFSNLSFSLSGILHIQRPHH